MKRLIFLSLGLLACSLTQAIVCPASLFNDGMVLQQQSQVKFWGRAKANTKVTVRGSWNNKTVTTQSDKDGRWMLHLQTPKAGFTPYEVTLSDGDKLTIHDVLIGEVWFASGQSNMEMVMRGFYNCPVENSNRYIAESGKYANKLRMVNVPHFPLKDPGEFVDAKWMKCEPATVREFSALGYFYATQLIDKLDVPVGVICNAWGGTAVEGWLPQTVLRTYNDKKLNDNLDTIFKKTPDCYTPSVMYNGMLKPLAGYTIKGFMWYQGETNVWNYCKDYQQRFSDMIKLWRKDWGQGDLPFLFVQIAPYNFDCGGDGALLREAQNNVQHQLPNCWMVSTIDLVKPYEFKQIHPCMKFEVGERMGLLSLVKVYGMKGVMPENPEYETMSVQDGKAILSFSHAEKGFDRFTNVTGFEIAGADKKFVPANAMVEGKDIAVSSPQVKKPVAVRYCFKDYAVGELHNSFGLPVLPFRTDK